MRILFLSCTLLISSFYSLAQQVRVPSRMEFAGIKLRIMDDAREEIQKDVDALTASPKYFEIKAERARTYFPIIERVFREENLPEDFKYLCLQESALISDAVSSSNAVGFWQFKDFTAAEVGLRVDKYVDERKNIVASSRGAAKYMHQNNQFFDNWLHALQAYQMGAGGAMKVLGSGDEGAKSMTINKKTYWYVKKYLAHKIAFEGATSQKGQIEISEYYDGAHKTLREIAHEFDLDEEEVEKYNKWLQKGRIPDDKPYAVILPKGGLGTSVTIAKSNDTKPEETKQIEYTFDAPGEFPKIEDPIQARAGKIVEINDLPGIVAGYGDRIPELAKKADIDLSKFLKYNDLGIDGRLIPGQVYYMKNKRGKAKAYYHVLQHGESLWSVSQKFGIKLKKLKFKNRIKDGDEVTPGRVLWLRYARPSKIPVEYREVELPEEKPEEKPVEPVIKESIQIPVKEEKADSTNVVIDSIEPPVISSDTTAVEESIDDLEEEYNESLEELEEESEDQKPQGILHIHEVKLGETYYAISKIYDVSVFDLLEWNNLKISDKLSVGQKVLVYTDTGIVVDETESPESDEAITELIHEVAEGDTLYKIAKMYNVSVQDIMEWNSKENFNISLGEKIKILTKKSKK